MLWGCFWLVINVIRIIAICFVKFSIDDFTGYIPNLHIPVYIIMDIRSVVEAPTSKLFGGFHNDMDHTHI